ncbi:MAG: hypothetical protein ABSE86_24640 [Bryobacteraceae bacterium]|jgi:hypothetical protein
MPSVTVTAKNKAGAKLSRAEVDYNPGQRRMIDREITKGLEDIKKGRVHGPFSASEATKFIKAELKTRSKKSKPK